ncbi:MAG: SDR family NAD(P)-dependent oxidoreductase [Ignavibacteriales bacterium]
MNILITGARGGIGYASALELLDRGHFVYLTVANEEQLASIKQDEKLSGKNVEFLKLDITNEEDRNKVSNLDIDVLINNAATNYGGSIVEADIERVRENYEVNIFGTISLTKIFLQKMIKNNKGRVLMFSSIAAEMPIEWMGIYSSTKAATKNLAIVLSKELKQLHSNVKVIIIEPGLYHTGFNQVMLENKYDNEDSIFKDIREDIRVREELIFTALEQHDLKSIVDQVVYAVEDENPKDIYKAPFSHTIMEKIYGIIKK